MSPPVLAIQPTTPTAIRQHRAPPGPNHASRILSRFESTNRRIAVGEKAYGKMLPMPTGNQLIAKANCETPANSRGAGERAPVIDNIPCHGLSLARG